MSNIIQKEETREGIGIDNSKIDTNNNIHNNNKPTTTTTTTTTSPSTTSNINNNNSNNNIEYIDFLSNKLDWLFIGDPLVESLKKKKEDKYHDLLLMESCLIQVEEELKVYQERRDIIASSLEVLKQENDKINREFIQCKNSVYSKWKSISDRYNVSVKNQSTLLGSSFKNIPNSLVFNNNSINNNISNSGDIDNIINNNNNNNINNNLLFNNSSTMNYNTILKNNNNVKINNCCNNSDINNSNNNKNNYSNNSYLDRDLNDINEKEQQEEEEEEEYKNNSNSNHHKNSFTCCHLANYSTEITLVQNAILPSNINNTTTAKIISNMEPFSLFQLLPLEVMVTIFENLSFRDINDNVSRVCKQWHNYTFSDSIWKNLFQKKWNDIDHNDSSSSCSSSSSSSKVSIPSTYWKNSIIKPESITSPMILPSSNNLNILNNNNNSNNNDNNDNEINNNKILKNNLILPSNNKLSNSDDYDDYEDDDNNVNNNSSKNNKRLRIDWRSLYIKRQRIENNWLKGIQKAIKLPGHSDWITCMEFDGEHLVTGSWDSSLKLWNIETGECKEISTRENGGHVAGITCVVSRGNRLISGSSDSTLRVWDIVTGECLHVLEGHTDGVSCVCIINDSTLVSGSLDHTINLWSLDSGKLLHTFTHNTSGISCLLYKNNLLINGTMSGVLNVVDIPTRIHLTTFNGHSDRVTSIQWWDSPDGPRIISSSWDYYLRVWNLHTGNTIHLLSGHTFRVRCTQVHGNILVSGSWDTTLKVWDLLTGRCLHTLFGHSFNVWSIQCEGNRLVSAGWDKKVKVWDIESGKNLYTLEGHTESIICIQFKGSKLVTAAKEIIVYDFDSQN